jgi:hypothetical protein
MLGSRLVVDEEVWQADEKLMTRSGSSRDGGGIRHVRK